MAGTFCNQGLYLPCYFMMGDATNGKIPATMRLFTNDFSPDASSTFSSFTEMSGRSYAPKSLVGTTWSWSGAPPVGTYSVPAWSFGAGTPITIYGYFLTNTDSGSQNRAIIAERWATPFELGGGATTLTVTLSYTFTFA